jgi:hypothetical protein
MEIHKPNIITDGGPWAEHDMACSVCHRNKAVLQLNTYRFLPCWKCQEKGHFLIWVSPFLRMILGWTGAINSPRAESE